MTRADELRAPADGRRRPARPPGDETADVPRGAPDTGFADTGSAGPASVNVGARGADGTVDALLQAAAERAATGDEVAFGRLHDALAAGLGHFFRRRAGALPELVEELCQRTWIEVWRLLGSGRYDPSRAAVGAFVVGVAANVWLRHCRATGREAGRREALALWGAASEAGAGGESRRDGTEEIEELLDLCTTLAALRDCVAEARASGVLDREDEVILAGLLRDRSEREIARELGRAPSSVHERKRLLLGRLRRCLAAKGHGR